MIYNNYSTTCPHFRKQRRYYEFTEHEYQHINCINNNKVSNIFNNYFKIKYFNKVSNISQKDP